MIALKALSLIAIICLAAAGIGEIIVRITCPIKPPKTRRKVNWFI